MTILVASVVLLYVLFCSLALLVVILYRQFGLVYLGSRRAEEIRGPAVGATAPEGLRVHRPGDAGSTLALDWHDVRPGGGTLVLLGGEACLVCAHLLRHLDAAMDQVRDAVRVVFIDRGPARPGDGEDVPPSRSGRWQHWRSEDGSVHDAFDIDVSPFGIVVDDGGVVRAKGITSTPEAVLALLDQASLADDRLSVESSQPASPAAQGAF